MNAFSKSIQFQSHNGLILMLTLENEKITKIEISIPQWSDFNRNIFITICVAYGISIPQWSDFNLPIVSIISSTMSNFNPTMV